MAEITFQEILDKIQANLQDMQLPPGFDLDMAFSEEFINHWSPLLVPLIALILEKIELASDEKTTSVIDFLKPFKDDLPQQPASMSVADFAASGTTYLQEAEAVYNWLRTTSPFKQFLRVLQAGTWFYGAVFSQLQINQEKSRQTLNQEQRPFILDVGTLVDMYFKDESVQEEVKETLTKYGITDTDITRLLDNAHALYTPEMIRRLYYLREISEDEAKQHLYRLRFSKDDFTRIEQAWRLQPSLSDITRFAVREAYKEPLSIEGILDADRPESFDAAAEEIGAAPGYAKLAWRSHWVLPSFQMGLEMLHRGIIADTQELKDLMKENDMHPAWRDALIEMSYNLFTRVDLRRVYQIGYYDEQQVYEEYLKLGYDEDRARALTDFTIDKYNPENKDLTKSDILKLYKHQEYSYDECIQALNAIGYNEEVADGIILRHDLDLAAKLIDKQEAAIKRGYIGRVLTYEQAVSRVQLIGYNNDYARDLVSEWGLDKDLKTKDLSVEHVEKFYKLAIRTAQETYNYLVRMGYEDQDAQDLVTLWGQEAQ